MKRIVFDIGATHLRLALAEEDRLIAVEKMQTPEHPEDAIESIKDYLARQKKDDAEKIEITEAVGGVAGIIRDGLIVRSPLPQWTGFDFGTAVGHACGVPAVRIFNDAEIAGIAEARQGSGKEYRFVGYLSIGTGVGGTLIIDGNSIAATEGIEPGKQILEYEKGITLEQLVGGGALEKEFGRPAEDLPQSIYEERTPALAAGLYNLARIWSPEALVVNGHCFTAENGFRLERVEQELARLAAGIPMPRLRRGALGDEAGLIGAMIVT